MRILVVDDSNTIRFMLVKLLNSLGYTQIDEAVDVESAMLQIRRNPPDLIFSDYNMPGKTGLDFLKMVRQHPVIGQVPFVMVTTVHDKKIVVDAIKSGLQHFVFKPFEKNVFVEKLTALSESHHIQPPSLMAPVRHTNENAKIVQVELPEHPLGLSPELCDLIVGHFFLVFDGELTMQDFQSWATENCLPKLPEACKIKSAQQLLELLRSSATEGILAALKRCGS